MSRSSPFPTPPALVLLDRDGLVVVNERTNIKRPDELRLIAGGAAAVELFLDATISGATIPDATISDGARCLAAAS